MAVCAGIFIGFLGCCWLGRIAERKNAFQDFARLHPFLEQESSYYPTASQLIATARSQCPPGSDKTLVVLGGNSVFNGSGQKRDELWSRVLQSELGDKYHVINFSAPGAGVMDTGGVVFEMLARDYPRMVLVTNTQPGSYTPGPNSSYSYLFWDAYYKGYLSEDPARVAWVKRDVALTTPFETRLLYRLNACLYFNDLWTGVAYRHGCTVWTSWLKDRSFRARRDLPDWYDKRPVIPPGDERFEELLPGQIAALRRREILDPKRYRQKPDGGWNQTEESLQNEAREIAVLLPGSLRSKALVVFTPLNPWFLQRLSPKERQWVDVSFQRGVELLEAGGFHAASMHDQPFAPFDFGDTVHLSPTGGQRLARAIAPLVRNLVQQQISSQP